MEAFALYLFKSVVWLTGFALVYLLFLRNERYFLLNRMYLVTGMVASILFPFFTWHYTIIIPMMPSVEVSDLQMTGIINEPEPFPTKEILLILYMAGGLYLLYRIIKQTITVVGVIRKSEILPYRSAKLIRTDAYPSSFSFFSFVFVNPSSSDIETSEIVNHEMEHITQRHWIDLLLFELLCTLQWLNPLCWLYGRFIRQNHEFLADQHALQRTQNPAIYRAALINQLFGAEIISLANSFNYSINKKRFHMMKNTIHPPYRKLKLLVILPMIAAVFYAFATPEYRYANGNEDQKSTYSITQDQIQIPFTNQLTKADLEAIKTDLAKVGMTADYTSLEFTNEGKLKGISAKVSTGSGSVSWNSKEVTANSYPVFKKEPNGEFGVYFTGIFAGKVLKPGGSPLQGAAVIIAGTNVGTITSSDGQFQLKDVPKDAELVISYVGYESVKVKPEDGKPTSITMNPVIVDMNEVTVTALASPDTKTLSAPLGSTIKLQTNSPLKFGNADGSSAQPLIVIDGVITENQNVNNIPPETIESISVLKGESAIKLYGDKGKNGVILITKKKESATSQNNLIDVNINQNANAQKNSQVYTVVEQMPEFPGGEMALRKFLAYNIKYPRTAVDKGIQGKEFVTFVVTSKGSVADAKILRGVDPSLDQEALRVVNSMPSWIPGKQGGKDVDVQYTLPINFVLEPAQTVAKVEKGNEPYTIVEQMPEYPGGIDALKAYLMSNIKYPSEAHQKGIQGKVFVSFVVTKTGSISNAKVVRGVDPLLDQEAMRVVESMPIWIPGKQNGETVDVAYTLPINFVLEKKPQSQADPSALAGLLLIAPNPTKSDVTVILVGTDTTNQLQVSIIDSYGKMVKRETKNGPSFTLSVSSLSPGTYRVVAVDGNKQYQGSLVVNH